MKGTKSCPAGFKFDKLSQQCKGKCNTKIFVDGVLIHFSRIHKINLIFKSIFFAAIDVDECAEAIHSCVEGTEQCRNTEGAYECDVKCTNGFIYNVNLGTCVGKYINYNFISMLSKKLLSQFV